MSRLALAASLLALSASAARAGLVTADLQGVGVFPPAGARVALDSRWQDERGGAVSLAQAMAGRPTLLVFADYTCNTLCSPILTRIGEAMAQSGLPPRGYRLVVLGLDPKDGPRAAARMKQERIADPAVAASAVLLSGDEATVRRAADAVGYRYAYDAAHDQFAHPAAVLALTADGRLARVLSGLGTTTDLRLALVEAGEGRIGTLRDRVRLLCYGFDPSVGVYTPSVHRALAAVSALTVLMLGAAIGWLSLRRARPS